MQQPASSAEQRRNAARQLVGDAVTATRAGGTQQASSSDGTAWADASATGQNQQGHTLRTDTFDVPTASDDLPPTVPAEEQYPVVLGCEVLYELLHAQWLPAALCRRLEPGGCALVIGAVRDAQVRLRT